MRLTTAFLWIPLCGWSQTAGVTPAWEVEKHVHALVAQVRRLAPVMEEIKTGEWNGAPASYAEQHKAAGNEIGYLAQTAEELLKAPDRMTKTLEAYFRLQSIESLLETVSQGVRQYQNPALADLMQGMISENNVHRGWLRSYLVELVSAKEDELRVMNLEAQRCRSELLRQPRPAQAPVRKSDKKNPG